jgi:nitrate reductase alpha subunit
MPMLVILDEHEGSYVNGRFLRAADFDDSLGEKNNPDWKTVVIDEKTGDIIAPNGSIGKRLLHLCLA